MKWRLDSVGWLDWLGLGDVGWGDDGDVKSGLRSGGLGLGDCVWCVLLPKLVANATLSSESTPPVSHG